MIVWCILLVALVALVLDWFIYRRIAAVASSPVWRRVYLVYALLVDLVTGVSLLCYGWINEHVSFGTHYMMWVVWFFLLNTLPKFLWALLAGIGEAISRITGARMRIFRWLAWAAAVVVAWTLIWGATGGIGRIEVRRTELTVPRLPETFDGLRIVQFSDTHIGSLVRDRVAIARMVDTINALCPDLVVNTGDLINMRADELTPEVCAELGRIRSRYGVYSVLGNHDLGIYVKDTLRYPLDEHMERLAEAQRELGWHLLVDSTAWIRSGTDSIAVTGLNYPAGWQHNARSTRFTGIDYARAYRGVPDSALVITLSHAPQVWDSIRSVSATALTLSGHVHSMQFKLRLGRRAWSPARWMYERWSGLYEEKGQYLYINDGFGYVLYPMRIGTRPEVTLITLHR